MAPDALTLGDDEENRQKKAILSFDASALPKDAVVRHAILEMRAKRFENLNPVRQWGGRLYVDLTTKADAQGDPKSPGARAVQMNNVHDPGQWSRGVVEPAGLKQIQPGEPLQALIYFQVSDNDNHLADELEFCYDPKNAEEAPRMAVYYTKR